VPDDNGELRVTKRDERWTAQDVAIVKARRELRQMVKTPPLEAATARTFTFTVPGLEIVVKYESPEAL
jgi:hypothetical protein